MPPAASSALAAHEPLAALASAPIVDDAHLRETLKRCSPATFEAASRFRRTGDPACVPVVIRGVIERFVERERRPLLENAGADLRLIEDLGVDSLTMMEIVMLAEEVLPISISNEELRFLRTLGEVEQFITCKIQGVPPPRPANAVGWYLDDVAAAQRKAAATANGAGPLPTIVPAVDDRTPAA